MVSNVKLPQIENLKNKNNFQISLFNSIDIRLRAHKRNVMRSAAPPFRFIFLCFFSKEGRADAVPTTRNYTPDSPDLDERRGQPLRSAMARSRPGGTALLITVTSAPSKFNCRAENFLLYLEVTVKRSTRNSQLMPLGQRRRQQLRHSIHSHGT